MAIGEGRKQINAATALLQPVNLRLHPQFTHEPNPEILKQKDHEYNEYPLLLGQELSGAAPHSSCCEPSHSKVKVLVQ